MRGEIGGEDQGSDGGDGESVKRGGHETCPFNIRIAVEKIMRIF